MLSCGTAVSAATHITRQKLIQLTDTFLLESFPDGSVPQNKNLCATLTAVPEHNKVGATALNFTVEISLADRIVVTSRKPQTELHYPDSKDCMKHSKTHVLTNSEASSNGLNINTHVYPLVTINGVSETCKTLSKPDILH